MQSYNKETGFNAVHLRISSVHGCRWYRLLYTDSVPMTMAVSFDGDYENLIESSTTSHRKILRLPDKCRWEHCGLLENREAL